MRKQDVLDILEQGGITPEFLEENDYMIEMTSHEWKEFVLFYIGKDILDDDNWDEDDFNKLEYFNDMLNEYNIDLV